MKIEPFLSFVTIHNEPVTLSKDEIQAVEKFGDICQIVMKTNHRGTVSIYETRMNHGLITNILNNYKKNNEEDY